MRVFPVGLFCLALLLSSAAMAEVPNRAHFNGYLNNTAGDPIDCPDAVQCATPVNIGFALYDSDNGESPLWEEFHAAVPIYQGSFHIELGSLNSLEPASTGAARYLGISINGGPEMLPRLSLGSSVFAMWAAVAENATDAENAAQLGGMEPTHYATSESVALLETGLAPIATTGSYNDLADVPAGLADGDDNTQLDEVQVDAFVANNGYALATELFSGDYDDLTNTPTDDDTLSSLSCATDEIPKWDGSAWACGADVDTDTDTTIADTNTQLSETQVDAFVANNGYALQVDLNSLSSGLATIASSGSFNDLTGVPAGIADGDDDTQLDEDAVDAFVANNGYAIDASLSVVGKTGLYTDLLSAPWVENAGHLEYKGTLSILGPGNSTNITLGSKNTTDEAEKGQLLIHDAEGDVSAMVNVGSDGAGMVSLYGPNGEMNLGIWNWLGSPDRPLLGLYGETGAQRLFLDITEDDAGRSIYYGPNGNLNVALWYPSTDPDDGTVSVFDDTGTERGSLGVTSSNAGSLQLYGPNGTHNFSMWHYGGTPDYGVFEIYDAADVVHASMGISGDIGGFVSLKGGNGEDNVYLGHYGGVPDRGILRIFNEGGVSLIDLAVNSDGVGNLLLNGPNGNRNISLYAYDTAPDHGAISLNDDAGTARMRLDVYADSNAGQLRLYGPNGTKTSWLSSYATKPDFGALTLYNDAETVHTRLDTLDHNAGSLRLYGPNGTNNIGLSSYSGSPDHGALYLYDAGDTIRARLDVFGDSNAGQLRLYGPNGNQNIFLSSYGSRPDDGVLILYDDTQTTRVRADIDSNHAGKLATYGPTGNYNSYNSFFSGYPDHGSFSVQDFWGSSQAGMYVNASGNGIVWGDTKNFRMEHPEDPEKEIWYACIEGPEAAAYARGTSTLVNGHARVELPEHFFFVAAEQGLTVTVTPLSADSKGMAVVEKTPAGFRVRELMDGRGTYEFDWEIKGVRRGYEDYQVIRPAVKLAGGVDPDPAEAQGSPENTP